MTEVARFEINETELNDACARIRAMLQEVEMKQDLDTAVRHAIKGLHGNVAYLMQAMSDIDVIEVLDDLRANILESIGPKNGEAVH